MNKKSTFVFLFIFLTGFVSLAANTALLAQIENKISALSEDKIQLALEKEDLEARIREMQAKIKERKSLITRRLKALYALKQYKWSELLVDTNLNEFERNVRILNNLNTYDYEIFREYNTGLKQLGLARKNLQETEILIEQNVQALQNQQGESFAAEKTHISDLQREKKDSLLMLKGGLARPLDGNIKQEFGTLRDQYKLFFLINHGELYNCRANSMVKSVGPGQVIFRDVLTRWRETLIVQHDDNYYSVYAGVRNPDKKVGDRVEKNEALGTCADSEFYFELRHFDNPINPKTWYRE